MHHKKDFSTCTIYIQPCAMELVLISIDDLSVKLVTKTSITTKESIEFYQVYNDNIKKNMESTVELQDNVENHLCNLCEYTTLNVSYLKRHTETCHEGVFYSCCQCDYKANMSHLI